MEFDYKKGHKPIELKMTIQKGTGGWFWSVMKVQGDYFEPTSERSIIYYKTRDECYSSAVGYCEMQCPKCDGKVELPVKS